MLLNSIAVCEGLETQVISDKPNDLVVLVADRDVEIPAWAMHAPSQKLPLAIDVQDCVNVSVGIVFAVYDDFYIIFLVYIFVFLDGGFLVLGIEAARITKEGRLVPHIAIQIDIPSSEPKRVLVPFT